MQQYIAIGRPKHRGSRLLVFVMLNFYVVAALAQACTVSEPDRAWLNDALDAWRFSAREISGAGVDFAFEAMFFDADCVLRTASPLQQPSAAEVQWVPVPHAGKVTLPTGQIMPAGVTSFAGAASGHPFFVMATPSVWRAARVADGSLGLERFMTAVLLHESAHVTQALSYGGRISALIQANRLPADFNDDSIQRQFGGNAAFAADVQREISLLFDAATAPDIATARSLAQQARTAMQARHSKWFTGELAYLSEAEDLWLSLEGSGQWLAYQWLIHPEGGALQPAMAMQNFARRDSWWSQIEGIALALALDRIAGSGWRQGVFGSGGQTLGKLLDQSLQQAAPAPGPSP